MPDIELKQIENFICKKMDFWVRDKELMVLLGPSGAGKTTLLNVIAGLVDYEGSVLIDGVPQDDIAPSKRGVGYLFQSLFLFPHFDVKANIEYGLKMRGDPPEERRARVDALLRLMKIEHLADRYPKHLSGGEKQRVALARALAPSPKILLLDEPFNNLDASISKYLWQELRRIQKGIGITTVYVTHSMTEARYLGDRLAVIRSGRFEEIGKPDDVIPHYIRKEKERFLEKEFVPKEKTMNGILHQLRDRFTELVDEHNLRSDFIEIKARPLSAEEAIGRTNRKDYPLVTGKERLIEARYKGAVGHAFTDMPGDHNSSIGELLALDLDDNANRAFFVASLNAVYRYLFPESLTVHCRDEDPEHCGKKIAEDLHSRFGERRIGFVGLNPAILENLAEVFKPENVFAVDLNSETIGKEKYGVLIRDGRSELKTVVEKSDVMLVTGTTLGNGTIDEIASLAEAHGKPCIFYGVTIAAAASLLGFERICPCAM